MADTTQGGMSSPLIPVLPAAVVLYLGSIEEFGWDGIALPLLKC